MSLTDDELRGVVHGKLMQLDNEAGLPDGRVSFRPVHQGDGEGFRQSAGAWADDADGVDGFLEATRQARKAERREIGP